MQIVRKFLLLFLASCTLLSSTACSDEKKPEPAVAKKSISTLSVYINTGDSLMIRAINEYNEKFAGKSKVQEVTFSNYEEIQKKMTAELLSGQGPDLLRVNPMMFPSTHKVMESGAFEDLNPLIQKENQINLDDYYTKVLNRGVFHGKRYLMPLGFDTPVFFTSQRILGQLGLGESLTGWTWERLADMALAYMQDSNRERQYFFNQLSFLNILESSGKSFVDYDRKVSAFHSDAFIEMLNLYRRIYPTILPADQKNNEIGVTSQSSVNEEGLKDINLIDYINIDQGTVREKESVLFNGENVGFGDPEYLRAINSGFENETGEKMGVIPFPTWEGKKNSYITVWDYIGINAKSSYKAEALRFIKILMDRDMDWNRPGTNKSFQSQINKKAYIGKQSRQFNKTIFIRPLPKALADTMNGIIGNIGDSEVSDGAVNNIILSELQDFQNGKKAAETTAKVIDEKVSLYLNE